jgi:hypothetical protein
MRITSLLPASLDRVRSQASQALFIAGAALVVSMPSTASAQSQTACGPEIKTAVALAVADAAGQPDDAKLKIEAQLYDKYKACGEKDVDQVPPTFVAAARECGAAVSNLGSLFYEEMPCVGYDPQRRQFAAPVKIKQPFGFGPFPIPGSREYVLHCVANPAGVLLPVAVDSVHLADSPNGVPSWQFAVIASANMNLGLLQPMSGATRNARSILSWNLQPTNCNYTPIWGNAVNYRIRLDQ